MNIDVRKLTSEQRTALIEAIVEEMTDTVDLEVLMQCYSEEQEKWLDDMDESEFNEHLERFIDDGDYEEIIEAAFKPK